MNTDSPFRIAESLLTQGESAFYPALLEAVAGRWHIQFKPRLEDVVPVIRNIPYRERESYRNRVKSRHVDFLLCMPDTLAPVLAIELDDWRHRKLPHHMRRDEQVDSILQSVGLPILHVQAQASYDPTRLEHDIMEKIHSPAASHSAPTMPFAVGQPQKNTIPLTRPRKQHSKRPSIGMSLLGLTLKGALTILVAVLLWMWVISAFQSVGTLFPGSSSRSATGTTPTPTLPNGAGQAYRDADAVVATAKLHMRSGPGGDLPSIGTFPEGTPLKVLGKDPTEYWLKVMVPSGKTGWMSGRFLKLTVSLSGVPIVGK